jgi:hypothetical protein
MTPNQPGLSWEDFDKYTALHFPVRHFLKHKIGRKLHYWHYKAGMDWYEFTCKWVPSRKFHLVNLSNVDPVSKYTTGYLNSDDRIELSCWSVLNSFVAKGSMEDPLCWDNASYEDKHWVEHKRIFDEVRDLHKWWNLDRLQAEEEETVLLKVMQASKKDPIIAEQYYSYVAKKEQTETDMLVRLIKIRKHLW